MCEALREEVLTTIHNVAFVLFVIHAYKFVLVFYTKKS